MFNFKTILRLDVRDQLPKKEDEKTYLISLTELINNKKQEAVFNHLYENLSILDAKSAALLQVNAILAAIFSIFLTSKTSEFVFFDSVIGIITTLISSYLLLDVVWVHWSTTDHMKNSETHELKLIEVRKERTICYRQSWNFTRVSVIAIFILACTLVIEKF